MDFSSIYQIGVLLFLCIGAAVLLSRYLVKAFSKKKLSKVEYAFFRIFRFDGLPEQSWQSYLADLLVFNSVGFLFLFVLQLLQNHLPLNPQGVGAVGWDLAFNTAASFVTNTNWQAYSGEATLSYLTQMLGLGVQNFLSAATGMAVVLCLARGMSRSESKTVGHFYTDATRSIIYVLLPISVIGSILLMSQGVVQNFSSYLKVTTLEGLEQILPMGPAASQIAIKQLGTNGGGFFGVNSAHPFENPTAFSNFLELFMMLLIPMSLPFVWGKLVGDKKHGVSIFLTMLLLFVLFLVPALYFEMGNNPAIGNLPFLEGKELRFGIPSSAFWGIATTATSNGSVNSMLSSFSPIAGGLALLNIMMGEIIFGGVGSGLYGMILFVCLAVFIAGLMVGRTPEYLGKKIEAREIKFAVVGVLAPSILILLFSAFGVSFASGLASIANKGPHGLTEVLYAFSSAAGNNGSAFAGLNANTPFYNAMTGFAMIIGRFAVIVPVIGIAGSLAAKKKIPTGSGTFPTHGLLFILLLACTIVVVGALTFFPALTLGPIAEHLLMNQGKLF